MIYKKRNKQAAAQKDKGAHDQIGCFGLNQACTHTLTYSVVSSGTEILGYITGNGNAKGLVHQYGKLVNLGRGRVAGDGVSAECVDSGLHGKLSDAHDGHLEAHGKTGVQMDSGLMDKILEIRGPHPHDRKLFPAGQNTEDGGKQLGENGSPGGTCHAHSEREDKRKIQHDVQQGGQDEEVQRCSAVPERPQDVGNQVVKNGGSRSEKHGEHVVVCHVIDTVRRLHPVKDRMGKKTADRGNEHCKGYGQHKRDGDALAHSLFIPGAAALAETDAEAAGDSLNKAENEVYDDRGGTDRGKGIGTEGTAYDHGIGQCVKKLEQISADDGNGKFQKCGKGTSLCQILCHDIITPLSFCKRSLCKRIGAYRRKGALPILTAAPILPFLKEAPPRYQLFPLTAPGALQRQYRSQGVPFLHRFWNCVPPEPRCALRSVSARFPSSAGRPAPPSGFSIPV